MICREDGSGGARHASTKVIHPREYVSSRRCFKGQRECLFRGCLAVCASFEAERDLVSYKGRRAPPGLSPRDASDGMQSYARPKA